MKTAKFICSNCRFLVISKIVKRTGGNLMSECPECHKWNNVPIPIYRLKNHLCIHCHKTGDALVIFDQYVSDISRLLRLECPNCGKESAKIISTKEYERRVRDG